MYIIIIELPQLVNFLLFLRTGTECDQLKPPEYGDVKLSGLTIGSHATYTCEDGFELLGNEFRSCEADGEWSGTDPTCQGIIEMLACNNVQVAVKVHLNFLCKYSNICIYLTSTQALTVAP